MGICINNQIDFVKTSTGFNGGGANVLVVKQIKSLLENTSIGIKASGGIRSYKFAVELLEAGASRLGTSSSIEIIKKNE